jgi:hypothetical protein
MGQAAVTVGEVLNCDVTSPSHRPPPAGPVRSTLERTHIGVATPERTHIATVHCSSSTFETSARADSDSPPGAGGGPAAMRLLLGLVLVVSGFHATLLLKSSKQENCSSRGRNSNVRALRLNMALDPHDLIQFQGVVRRVEALEKEVKRIPDLDTVAKRIQDLETKVKRIPDLELEITTVSGDVQTLAGNRAIIVASQVLLIHVGVQPRIKVQPSKYFLNALDSRRNPDFSTTLEGVFKAADYKSRRALSARFDRMVDSRKLGAHPSDLGYLGDEAAKLVKILQRRVAAGTALDTDEATALLVLEHYADLANAVHMDKIV